MPAARKRDLLSRRRRVEDDGEDETSIVGDHHDDSLSEASLISDDDADADDSDLSETDAPKPSAHRTPKGTKSTSRASKTATDSGAVKAESNLQPEDPQFTAPSDTVAMLNGLRISGTDVDAEEALDFESVGKDLPQQPVVIRSEEHQMDTRKQETPAERRRREHEEYKKKRDADPAFIPNRGAFFMHDHRSAGPGQNGFRPFGRGRGRGVGGVGMPYPPLAVGQQAPEPTSNPWTHDLHDTLLESGNRQSADVTSAHTRNAGNPAMSAPSYATPNYTGPSRAAPVVTSVATGGTAPTRTFSVTKALHAATGRVFIPGMKEAKPFTVSIKIYAKLPNHRPPLRRDKPVRISLPDHPPRYIFPAVDRSFIFIPRAMRPNQGLGRGRGRGLGSMTGFSSRRTSVHGGSMYSPSIAMSRRSSIARDFNRETLVSPSASAMASGRPVVRLPPGSQGHTPIMLSGAGTPVTAMPPYGMFPPPMGFQPPQKSIPANMQMHQPRPQKAVSVAGIESPSGMPYGSTPQQDQLPFHQQVPQHLNGNIAQAAAFHPGGQPFAPQPTSGTPLSHIPERAIHAQTFQPFQPQGYQQQMYYHAPANAAHPQYGSGAVIAPMFVPAGQQGAGYMMPTIAPAAPQNVQPPTAPAAAGPPGQAQMVAYEQNGMVYYYDPNQMQQVPNDGYGNQNYTMPGMGGMMTPAPDGYYYPQMPQGPAFYPGQ